LLFESQLAVAASVMLLSVSAWAGEGDACQVTTDCSATLHCIDERCAAVEDGKIRKPPDHPKPHWSPWFGDGHGYVAMIVIGDTLASIAAATLIATGFSARSGPLAIASLFPTTLTGPIIHAANGRAAPAVVSFFAWASAPPTSIGAAALTGLGKWSQTTAIVTGSIVGVSLAIVMTTLDAFMARRMKKPGLDLVPSIAPTRDGVSLSVDGAF
jgi:hypothetical protein